MSKFYNRVRHATATTGTGTLTLGQASIGFASAVEAGIIDASTVTYVIEDGNNFEVGRGTYSSGSQTLTRSQILISKIDGEAASTSLISLSGSAKVFLTAAGEDLIALDANGAAEILRVGIGGATADATNRLSSNSPAVLFNHAGDNSQVKVNKASAGDTASFVFQNDFSGRAEIGLVGSDDFQFKVSPDGTNFFQGILIDKDDGTATFPSGVSYLDLVEIAVPADPSANILRMFAVDDGTGITKVASIDADGNTANLSHFKQALTGATTRLQTAKLAEVVSIEDFGAKDDGNDYTTEVQAAIDTGYPVFVPPRDYIIDGFLTLPNNSAGIIGVRGGSSGSDYASYPGVSRLIFTGTGGGACIRQTTTTSLFLHSTFKDICLIADTGSTYDWIMDFHGMVNCTMHGIQAQQVDNDNGGILRNQKTAADIAWINRLYNFNFAVPQTSGAEYVIDVDWSDSQILNGNTDGGKGIILRGHGNVAVTAVQFNNAVSGEAGLTLRKEETSAGFYPVIGCAFDANTTYGVKIDASANPGGTVYAATFVGCNWRNPGATNDVLFVDASSAISGVSFDGCKFTDSGVTTALAFTGSKWNIAFGGGNYFASGYKIPSRTFTPTLAFGGGSTGLTYTTQTGFYRIVDNQVTFELTITLSNKGTSTGSAVISGLPASAAQLTPVSIAVASGFSGLTGGLAAAISGGGIILYQTASNGNAAIADTVFTNTSNFRIAGSYLIA